MSTLEDLIAGVGWDRIEAPAANFEKDRDAQHRAMLDDASVIAKPFQSDAGRACLKVLVERTLLRPLVSLPVEGQTAEAQAMYAAMRQGQNSVVTIIINALNAVESAKPLKE